MKHLTTPTVAVRPSDAFGTLRVHAGPRLLDGIGHPERTLRYMVIASLVVPGMFVLAANLLGDRIGFLSVAVGWAVDYPIAFAALCYLVVKAIKLPIGQYLRASWGIVGCCLGGYLGGLAVKQVLTHESDGTRMVIVAATSFVVTGLLLAFWQKIKGRFFVNSYVKAKFLTHDPVRIASFESDPLITRPIASNILVELYQHAARIVADARAITVPTQLLLSGSDWVVRHGPQHEFFVNLGSRTKERHVLPGFFHDTLGERDRAAKALDRARMALAANPEAVARIDGLARDLGLSVPDAKGRP